jgi:hypothetical protein
MIAVELDKVAGPSGDLPDLLLAACMSLISCSLISGFICKVYYVCTDRLALLAQSVRTHTGTHKASSTLSGGLTCMTNKSIAAQLPIQPS